MVSKKREGMKRRLVGRHHSTSRADPVAVAGLGEGLCLAPLLVSGTLSPCRGHAPRCPLTHCAWGPAAGAPACTTPP